MTDSAVINLWRAEGILALDPNGATYTRHPAHTNHAAALRGHFQALRLPTVLKELCVGKARLTAEECAQGNCLLATLNLPVHIDPTAANRDGWLVVDLEHDGKGFVVWPVGEN